MYISYILSLVLLLVLRALLASSTSFFLFVLPCVLFLSISVTIFLSVLSFPFCKAFVVVSRACVYECCVTSLLVPLMWLSLFFFFFSVCNGPNVTLHLYPGQSLHTLTSGSPHPVKKVQKNFKNNYASVECGAKILSANSEAKVRHTSPLSTAAYIQTQMLSCRWKKPASFHLGYVFKPNLGQ